MPNIMTYDQWMRRTRRGPTKPRSEELRSVDFALRNYTTTPSNATLDLLAAAVDMWAGSKDDPAKSIRNSDGAVTELFAAIRSQKQARGAPATPAAAQPARSAPAAAPPARPAPSTAAAGPRAIAHLKATCGISKHPNHGNVTWEGFSGDKIAGLCRAYDRALEAATMAAEGMRAVAEGRPGVARRMYELWFGAVDKAAMPIMVQSAGLMVAAMKTRPITFVLKDQTFDYEDPSRNNTINYGYVFKGGADATTFPHHTGTGMRVYLGQIVQDRVLDDHASTHTIYHELSHKVVNTVDLAERKRGVIVTVYGAEMCKAAAKHKPTQARQLADNWSFYAMSFLKDWAPPA